MEIPFLQENKNIGLLLMILGLLSIIAPIVYLATWHGYYTHISGWWTYVLVMGAIIGIISGLIYILAGMSVRDSKDDKFGLFQKLAAIVNFKIEYDIKVGVPAFIILVWGVVSLLSGILTLFTANFFGIVSIIIGIIFIFVAPMVAGQNKPDYAKIIWLIAVILLIIGLIFAIIGIFGLAYIMGWGGLGVVYGLLMIVNLIITILISLYMLLAFLSDDIKNNMGADYF